MTCGQSTGYHQFLDEPTARYSSSTTGDQPVNRDRYNSSTTPVGNATIDCEGVGREIRLATAGDLWWIVGPKRPGKRRDFPHFTGDEVHEITHFQ